MHAVHFSCWWELRAAYSVFLLDRRMTETIMCVLAIVMLRVLLIDLAFTQFYSIWKECSAKLELDIHFISSLYTQFLTIA